MSRSLLRRGAIAVIALGALGVAGYLRWGRPAPAPPRPPAPELGLVDLDGAPLSLAALRGHVVLIDFWATWCAPCRDEIPHLVELAHAYQDRGVRLIGVSMDDDAAPVRAFARDLHVDYPIGIGDVALATRFGGVLALPAKFLIDRQGRIAAHHVGAVDPQVLAGELDRLLAEPE